MLKNCKGPIKKSENSTLINSVWCGLLKNCKGPIKKGEFYILLTARVTDHNQGPMVDITSRLEISSNSVPLRTNCSGQEKLDS